MSKHDNKRAGKCYMYAYRHILEQGEGTLIHAEVWSERLGRMIDHALVETEMGFIYEPVLDRYFRKAELYEKFKVKELVRYTVKEALSMAVKTRHYGPWI